jgi:hypothetical protein
VDVKAVQVVDAKQCEVNRRGRRLEQKGTRVAAVVLGLPPEKKSQPRLDAHATGSARCSPAIERVAGRAC